MDQRKLLQALAELYRATDLASFPRTALKILGGIFTCSFLSYNEINMATQGLNVLFEPEEMEEVSDRLQPLFWKWKDQHPLTRYVSPGRPGPARAISQFLQPEELHRLELYHEFLQPMGVEDTMIASIWTSSCSTVHFALNRSPALGHFTRADLDLADLLRPHLVQAFENSFALTESRALTLLAHGVVEESKSYGLLLTDAGFRIIHRNEVARELLILCFGEHRGEVPALLRTWIREKPSLRHPRRPLELASPDGRSIRFRRCALGEGGWLVVVEEKSKASPRHLATRFGLSPREAEVLYWLTQGKSNPEIGIILEVSPRTVDKHMQRILLKLQADSRAAAIVIALGD